MRPGVLMVTGAYYPELSGAGLQCRTLVRQLGTAVDWTILTTTADPSSAGVDLQDDVTVHRVFINPGSRWSKVLAAVRFAGVFFRDSRRFSIVHLHGFSQKSVITMGLAWLTRKRVAIKLTSVGHDDPISMRDRGGLAYWCYRRAAMWFAISPRVMALSQEAGLPPERMRVIPNGVNIVRFRPPAPGERSAIRQALGWIATGPIVLFVGFFSREKRPDLLFEAWASLAHAVPDTMLVFVGATRSRYYEIDGQLVADLHRRASALGVNARIQYVERTDEIELFYRAVDIFVLPSVREGLPNALLEAMASGAACVATRLPGVTEGLIHHGRNGLLVPADERGALEMALRELAADPDQRVRLGAEARRTIESQYGIERVAVRYLEAYEELLGHPVCAA